MWQATKRSYGEAWQFTKIFPALVGLVVLLEGVQHIVEWLSGYYVSVEAAQAAEGNLLRLTLGGAKAVAIVLLGYWVPRYLLSQGSKRFTTAFDPTALRRYGVAALCYVLISAVAVFAVALFGALLPERALLPVFLLVAGAMIRTLLSFWMAGAAVADPAATLVQSIRSTQGCLLWGTGVAILCSVPPFVLHYVLGLRAIGMPPTIAAAMLAADALVVGFTGALLASVQVQVARRVAAQHGHALTAAPMAAE